MVAKLLTVHEPRANGPRFGGFRALGLLFRHNVSPWVDLYSARARAVVFEHVWLVLVLENDLAERSERTVQIRREFWVIVELIDVAKLLIKSDGRRK